MNRLKLAVLSCTIILALIAFLLSIGKGEIAFAQAHPAANCGNWSLISSPNPASSNFLNGVAALTASNVWAVGEYSNGNGGLTLVEHWDGAQWSVVTSPNVSGAASTSLAGVAAISSKNVWAVGTYNLPSNSMRTLIEHWNGTQWSIISSPNVGSGDNYLTAVAAVSARNIWAVGVYVNTSSYSQTLVEHWNGSSWSVVASPDNGSGENRLTGVAALSATNIWAVGFSSSTNSDQPLVEHWNGMQWSIVPSTGPGAVFNSFYGVTALSARNVWAVGYSTNSVGPSADNSTLIEHWNGTSWSTVSSPNSGVSDVLNAVAAVSSKNIWAVGDYRDSIGPFGPYFTLIEHWDGTSWSVVNAPSPGGIASDLNAVARVPHTNKVWSVGIYQSTSDYQTLTEFYC